MKGSVRTLSLQRIDPRTGQTTTQTLKVRIPPGVREGQLIRVAGMGGDGIGGGGFGDLYLRVRQAAHPDCQVRAKVIVPTLKGRASVRIRPGTNNGQQSENLIHWAPHSLKKALTSPSTLRMPLR